MSTTMTITTTGQGPETTTGAPDVGGARVAAGRSRRRRGRRLTALAFAAALSAAPLAVAAGSAEAGAQTVGVAPCRVQTGASLTYVANNTLLSCARMIRASAFTNPIGVGTWGPHAIAVTSNSQILANSGRGWQSLGFDPSVSSLSDRCGRGDARACNTWRANAQAAISALNRLYPNGWAR